MNATALLAAVLGLSLAAPAHAAPRSRKRPAVTAPATVQPAPETPADTPPAPAPEPAPAPSPEPAADVPPPPPPPPPPGRGTGKPSSIDRLLNRMIQQQPPAEEPAAEAPPPAPTFPQLDSRDPAARVAEAARLGRVRETAAGPALLTVLVNDPDPEVRLRAAWALGRVRCVEAVGPLRAALESDASLRVRRAAALALGDVGTPEAVEALAARLTDPNEHVAAAAAEGLGRARPENGRELLAPATRDPRALVSLTAKRVASTLPAATPVAAAPLPVASRPWCGNGLEPPACRWRRDRSDGVKADAVLVAGSAVLGGVAGAFLLDGLRPYQRGVRVTPRHTTQVDNGATPLERAIGTALGAGSAAAAASAWTWFDDVTASRAGLVALMAAEGVAVGAAGSLAFALPRHQAVTAMVVAGTLTTLSAVALTWLPGDFSYGDVAWTWTTAALGFAVGALGTLVLVPSGAGRPHGYEGSVGDVGDLFGMTESVYKLPWGKVSRLELSLAAGLTTSALSSLLTASTLAFYEVGTTRALRTLGAAMVGAMLLGLPPALLLPRLPSPWPTPERLGAGMALVGGLSAGALAFALSSNEDDQGPLVLWELPGRFQREPKTSTAAVSLGPPTVAVMPPVANALGTDHGGVYLGLVNARF